MSSSADPPFQWMQKRLDELDSLQLRRRLRPLDAAGVQLIDSHGNRLINFGSNDYLGLGSRPQEFSLPNDGAPSALRGGSGASPLVCGYTPAHDQLAQRLAALEQTEAAVLYPSGYAACCGCVSALARRGDLILSDALNHASLIDGCRLSRAERFVYPHADVDAVQALLKHHRRRFTEAWIVTDSIFSMDGDIAPLVRLADIAQRYAATLIVDEAHGTGVMGDDGSGVCGSLGVKADVAIRIGTLSKALGSQGGFVVGPRVVIDYLINHSRPLIYSTAATPASVAAALAALDSIAREPEKREHLRALAAHLRAGLRLLGYSQPPADTLAAGVPIISLRLGDAGRAVRASEQLREAGFYVPAIRPPTVPPGTARLRISLSAAHTQQQVDRLLAAIGQQK